MPLRPEHLVADAPLAREVAVSGSDLHVALTDGRRLTLPLAWYPRLAEGTPAERANWRLLGIGEGIHWPDLDEDLNVDGLLAGRRSRESPESLARWRAARAG